jgi:hypothetical protein
VFLLFILLGIFDSVFNWVLNKILSPVFNFVSNLLGTVITWIFQNILAPVIKFALEAVFPALWKLLITLLAGFLYGVLAIIFKLIDTVQSGFDVLIGLQPVRYSLPTGGTVTNKSLLEVLFTHSVMGDVFFRISVVAVVLAFLAAIYATARSALDFDMENKRPVGQVMRSFFKSGVTFLMVPLLMFFMISLSGVVLKAFNEALGGGQGSLGRAIFLVSTLDAGKTGGSNPSFTDPPRSEYWIGNKDYTNTDTVKQDFYLEKIDFITAYASALFALLIMAMCIIIFVQRIFEILMLYIVAPFFVAVMPIDDGEKFSKWREMFIAKVFTGFGAAIGMRLYLMVLPMIMDGNFSFYATPNKMDYVIKLLFVLGGAWAVYKSSSMLTTLLNFQAGQSEARAGAMGAALALGAVAGAGSLIGSGIGAYRARSARKEAESQQAKDDIRDEQAFRSGGGGAGGAGRGGSIDGVGSGGGGEPRRSKADMERKARMDKRAKGQTLKYEQGADGKSKLKSVNLGLLKWKRGADGKMRFNRLNLGVLRFKRQKNEGGAFKFDGGSIGVMNWRRDKKADGSYGIRVNKVNAGVAKWKRETGQDGVSEMRLQRLNLGVVKCSRGEDPGGGRSLHVDSANFGVFKFHRGEGGATRSFRFMGQDVHQARGEDGSYHTVGTRLGGNVQSRMDGGDQVYRRGSGEASGPVDLSGGAANETATADTAPAPDVGEQHDSGVRTASTSDGTPSTLDGTASTSDGTAPVSNRTPEIRPTPRIDRRSAEPPDDGAAYRAPSSQGIGGRLSSGGETAPTSGEAAPTSGGTAPSPGASGRLRSGSVRTRANSFPPPRYCRPKRKN